MQTKNANKRTDKIIREQDPLKQRLEFYFFKFF